MLLKLESPAKVEYYPVSKKLPLTHNSDHKQVHKSSADIRKQ